MSTEDRLAALEARLQAAEDHLAILNLLNSYGPLVDSATTKGALIVLSKTIAREVGPYGIRCNCLVPGAIDTELLQNHHARIAGERGVSLDEVRAEATKELPLKTFSTAEDIANMALFLASDQARTITGQAINVDAGFTI